MSIVVTIEKSINDVKSSILFIIVQHRLRGCRRRSIESETSTEAWIRTRYFSAGETHIPLDEIDEVCSFRIQFGRMIAMEIVGIISSMADGL